VEGPRAGREEGDRRPQSVAPKTRPGTIEGLSAVATDPHRHVNLAGYRRIIRDRRFEIALVAVATVGTALFLTFRQSALYESEARVQVQPQGTGLPGTSPELSGQDLEEERAFLVSLPVVERATTILDEGSEATLLRRKIFADVEEGGVLVVRVQDADPSRAARLDGALVESYVDIRSEQRRSDVGRASRLRSTIRRVDDRVRSISAQIRQASERKAAELESRREAMMATREYLQKRLLDVEAFLERSAVSIRMIQTPDVHRASISPQWTRKLPFLLVAGMALGIGFAVVRERLGGTPNRVGA
jgi:uncharacterized protein involved in exopolysaccharide biosynthesis